MPKGGDHRLLVPGSHHAPRNRVLHPGLGGVPLEPAERTPDRPVVGLDDARVAADQRRQGYRFRRAEGQVAARPVVDFAVADPTAETPAGSVRDLPLKHGFERVGIDRAFQAERLRAPARPGARLPVLRRVLRVVAVFLVVAGPLRRARHRADRGDHQTQRP